MTGAAGVNAQDFLGPSLPGEHHAARLLLLAEPRRQRHDSFPFLTCSEKNKCHNVARRAAGNKVELRNGTCITVLERRVVKGGGYKGELCHIRSRKGDGWVKAECVGGHF